MPAATELLDELGLSTDGDLGPFQQALTHRSVMGEPHYERLEFLGDAVLKLAISGALHDRYPGMDEGQLTKVRARVVSDQILAEVASRLRWARFLRLGPTERATRGAAKVGTLASSLEAFLGALYLRGGMPEVQPLVERLWDPIIAETARNPGAENHKAHLQELTQGLGKGLPIYRLVGEEGPQHHRTFTIEVAVAGEVLGEGRGISKKAAEQQAAARALERLRVPERSA